MEDLYLRIVKYLKERGETDISKFELKNGDVSKWKYAINKPSSEELNSILIEDIEKEKKKYIAKQTAIVLPSLTQEEAIESLPSNSIYINSTTGALDYVR